MQTDVTSQHERMSTRKIIRLSERKSSRLIVRAWSAAVEKNPPWTNAIKQIDLTDEMDKIRISGKIINSGAR